MLLEPTSQRTVRNILANDDDLIVIDIGVNQWQNIRMPAGLQPDSRFLFECFEIDVLAAWQFQGELSGGDSGALLSQPDDAETAEPDLADQRVRTEFSVGLRHGALRYARLWRAALLLSGK